MHVISKETLEVLKNFASIEPSLYFPAGQVIRTIDSSDAIFARAEIDLNIPQDFAIADLNEFLRGLSNFETPAVVFKKDRLVITEGAEEEGKKRKREVDYQNTYYYEYSDPDALEYPEQDRLDMATVDVVFEINDNDFKHITKAARSLKLDLLEFEGTGSRLNLVARSSQAGSRQVFSRNIGNTNRKFKGIVKLSNFKLIPATYKVELSSHGVIHFVSERLEYWMGLEHGSTFT